MKYTFTAICFAMLSTHAIAQKVYKCTSTTGAVTFTHDPCGADAKEVDTTKANRHSAPTDRTDTADAVTIDDMDRECAQRVENIRRNASVQIGHINAEIAKLKTDMIYSKNNLAGAQRDTGIQTEITGLEARIGGIETTRDTNIFSAEDSCRVRREAEVKRQNDLREQRQEAASKTKPVALPMESKPTQH
jgi:hypothetical protein